MTESMSRSQRLAGGVASSLAARGVAALVPIVLIPVTLSSLGPDNFGVWMAITSVTSMFIWADLGLGNALMTRLTPLIVARAWTDAWGLVRASYRILGGIAGFLAIAVGLAVAFVPWAGLLNAPPESEVRGIVGVSLFAFVVNLPLALVHRVLFAFQRVSLSNALQLTGSAGSVVSALGAVTVDLEPAAVVLSVVLPPVAINLVASIVCCLKMRSRGGVADRVEHRTIVVPGLKFVAVSAMSALAMNVDFIIVARAASVEDVAWYSVMARIFLALGLVVTVANTPLWPANAEALARGDLRWVRQVTLRMMAVSGATVLTAGGVLTVLREPLVRFLAGDVGRSPIVLALGLVLLWTAFGLMSPMFMAQNAIGVLGPQTFGWLAFLVATVPAKWLVAEQFGIEWIPWVSLLAYVCAVVPASIVGFRRVLSRPLSPVEESDYP